MYFRLLKGFESILQIQSAWDELARSVATSHFTQTFDWCRLGWENRDVRPGDRFFCATAWESDKLISVWAFIARKTRFGTSIEPVGSGMQEEYSDPLIAEEADNARICKSLVRILSNSADLIDVYFVRQGGPIDNALNAKSILNIPTPMMSYSIEKNGSHRFDQFLLSYSSNFRANLKQKRKRLEKLGALSFELPENIQSSVETIDWVIAEKQKWLVRQQKTSQWLDKEHPRAFLIAASTLRSELGRLALFRLTLDGRPIAAFLATIDRTRTEMMVTSFDPEYGRFSPGMLLIEDVTQWSFENGLTFDMRPLRLEYKERWANTLTQRISYTSPLTWKGVIILAPALLKFRAIKLLKAALNPNQRAAIRLVMEWCIDFKRGNHTPAASGVEHRRARLGDL